MNLTSHVLVVPSRGSWNRPIGANSIRQTKVRRNSKKQLSHSNAFAIQSSQRHPSDRVCVSHQSAENRQE